MNCRSSQLSRCDGCVPSERGRRKGKPRGEERGAGRDGRKVKEANKDTDPGKEKRVSDKLESAEKKRRQEIHRFRAKIACGPCCRDVVHGGELSFFF